MYFKVANIEKDKITVENSHGNTLYVSKDILTNMNSADHYDSEVGLTTTAMCEMMQ